MDEPDVFEQLDESDHIDYDAFGRLEGPCNGDRYRFTGRKISGETALLYNRTRYYDPAPGRWLSEDPLAFDAGDGRLHAYPSPAAPSAGADENP
jgi:RHS repeat-associated protein